MRKNALMLLALLLVLLLPTLVLAGPDDYIGDTAIYGGETASVKPNVLIIFDSSGSMSGTVDVEICVPDPDFDDDGVNDVDDNCVAVANADQNDTDGDGIGDLCDNDTTWPDTDGDTIADNLDNCIITPNTDQLDTDGDGVGDVCQSSGSGSYDPIFTYTSSSRYCGKWDEDYSNAYDDFCSRNVVYQCDPEDWDNGFCEDWNDKVDDVNDIHADCSTQEASLKTTGQWLGPKKVRDDECSNRSETYYYATGNWINWYNLTGGGAQNGMSSADELYAKLQPDAAQTAATSGTGLICSTQQEAKRDIARNVVRDLILSTNGVNFGVMRFNDTDRGGKFITQAVSGSNYTSYVKDMNGAHTTNPDGTTLMTNETALLEVVSNIPAEDYTPLGEALFESMRYFRGGQSAFTSGLTYTSPINAGCQQNYVILITDGMATRDDDNVLRTICTNGDCDSDSDTSGSMDYLDDVAKYMYLTDMSTGDTGYGGIQNVITYTVGFGLGGANADAVQLLQDTADNGQGTAPGDGQSYLASSYQTLAGALSTIIGQILEVNTAFVAPVVPTSPENKIYSGQRLYLGFFKPIVNSDWKGNLKKFGFLDPNPLDNDRTPAIVDKNGAIATDINDNFRVTSISYWATTADGANVDQGGVGELLVNRDFSTDPRKIYTIAGPQLSLTHSQNLFTVSNNSITAADMQVASNSVRDSIINYVHGYDAYDDDLDVTTLRRKWILGDILHSKPIIYPYAKAPAGLSSAGYSAWEANATLNQTMIYVGANDGQLHAFRDSDGKELWSFIPPDVLPNLRFLHNNIHNYFIDGSPTLYTYDHDGDGNVGPIAETTAGDVDGATADAGLADKAILLFGLRRGGGLDTLLPLGSPPDATTSRGAYHALDVTNPAEPKYMWKIDNTVTGFEELGETWSQPTIGKLRLNGTDRIVALFGAGYDNNEDLRFGNTQTFPDGTNVTTETTLLANDAGGVASLGTAAQFNPKGRGIYIVEIGTLSSAGVPTMHSSPLKLWGYVHDSTAASTDPNNPLFSFPSAVKAIDSDFDGYLDTVYVGDTGGNMWRFDISHKGSTGSWTGTKIFSSNPSVEGTPTNGRRILYPPAVVLESHFNGIYFGTGDRAHPLNQGVTERMYALFDRGQTTAQTEANMEDVTLNELQFAAPPVTPPTCTSMNFSTSCILERLKDQTNYGWFIRLTNPGADATDRAGEKILAESAVFNGVAYFTSFQPNITTTDACLSGNLGLSRVYAVKYLTGEAVFNFDTANDGQANVNQRAMVNTVDNSGGLLRRTDREKALGAGIASGVVITVDQNGDASALIGSGGGVIVIDPELSDEILPVYWREK